MVAKPFLAIACVALVVNAMAEDEATPNRISSLQQTFRYAPLLPAVEFTLVPESEPVVVLMPLVVTGSTTIERSFQQKMEIQPTRLAEQVLFWKGKAIASKNVRGVRADVGVWFQFGEKTVGVQPSRDIYIKVELLRFGW